MLPTFYLSDHAHGHIYRAGAMHLQLPPFCRTAGWREVTGIYIYIFLNKREDYLNSWSIVNSLLNTVGIPSPTVKAAHTFTAMIAHTGTKQLRALTPPGTTKR